MARPTINTYDAGGLIPAYDPQDVLVMPVKLPAGVEYAAGTVLGHVTTTTGANEVQTLVWSDTPDAGTYRLVFDGQFTPTIAYNATSTTLDGLLEDLSSIGEGNVAVTGSAATTLTFTFGGDLAGLDLPLLSIHNNVTDGGVATSTTITTTVPGNPGGGNLFAAYSDAASDGTAVARAILKHDTTVTVNGRYTVAGGGEVSEYTDHAPAYFRGTFNTADLTGLDANGIADLGKLLTGTAGTATASTTILRVN